MVYFHKMIPVTLVSVLISAKKDILLKWPE